MSYFAVQPFWLILNNGLQVLIRFTRPIPWRQQVQRQLLSSRLTSEVSFYLFSIQWNCGQTDKLKRWFLYKKFF